MLPISVALKDKFFSQEPIKQAIKEAKNYKSRETLVFMKPKQFLEVASQRFTPDKEKLDNIRHVIELGDTLSDVPYLKTDQIDGFDFKVVGHEGRHRAMFLNTVNINYMMPVRIIDASVRWIEDELNGEIITLYAQDSNARRISIRLP